jgi:hypothetical protein
MVQVPAGAPSLTSIYFRITSDMFSDSFTSCRVIRVRPAERIVNLSYQHEHSGSFLVTPFATGFGAKA